ncbi:flavodoxin [Paenibacillus periandrae]|uniref:flavodoxin n=1 Tax=Paenibacillus periandrae TaxID=1761741 RepID=UPI001F09535B|nr:flavodoxin [Paenibacillus periandrae]
MSKILMVFTSLTGNTRDMADAIAEGIKSENVELDIKEVMYASGDDLLKYDGIALGAYTWGDGDLPDEFLDFFDEMSEVQLDGQKAIVFGSCDSSYPVFGGAVDQLVDKLKEIGAEVVAEGLKIEMSPSQSELKQCQEFGASFAKRLVGIKQ